MLLALSKSFYDNEDLIGYNYYLYNLVHSVYIDFTNCHLTSMLVIQYATNIS